MGESDASDLRELESFSSSESMLRLVDALRGLDRETLSQVISAYLYFRSKGRSDRDFLEFILKKRLPATAMMALTLLGAVLPGLISDAKFRSVFIGAVSSVVRGRSDGSRRAQTAERPDRTSEKVHEPKSESGTTGQP